MKPGVYPAVRTNGSAYFRSSITFRGKHISLGSYDTEDEAHSAYTDASRILNCELSIDDAFEQFQTIPFDKLVSLINFRDNNMYIPNPIYLQKYHFSYYLDTSRELKFDIDDLFYYSEHKILQRKGHLYVNDYGMQVTIQSRYGIKSHAVCGRDYRFVNGDTNDYRYSNIEVINPYFGVARFEKAGQFCYRVRIHINGNYTIGTYHDEIRAAIAYNKAVDMAKQAGIQKDFPENYIESLSAREYADLYIGVKISPRYIQFLESLNGSG